MQKEQEQRKFDRVSAELAVYIEVLSTTEPGDEENRILRTETVDVSSRGFKIWSPRQLAIGSILQLAAELPGQDEDVLVLAAEVRWTSPAEYDDGYWIGFNLFNASDSDIERWEALINEMQLRAG